MAEPAASSPLRLRIRYTKIGTIRYTSQRDVARAWERALRRAKVPLRYSEGFSPRPLLSFSLALPTGCESRAEYMDLRLADPDQVAPGAVLPTAADLASRLSGLLPEGLEVEAVATLEESGGSLQDQVTSCSWIVEVAGMGAQQLTERVETLLSAAHVPIERVRKAKRVTDDLRPSVESLSFEGPGATPGTLRIAATLGTKPRGVRPAELLGGIDPSLRLVRASRMAQFIDLEGRRLEPLTADGRILGAADPMAAERGR